MKNTFVFVLFIFIALVSQAQKDITFENIGSYELLPNAKVSYPFNRVNVFSDHLDLFMDNTLVQTLSLLGIDEKSNYKVIQTFPELSAEKKSFGEMKITYIENEQGILQVQVHGTNVSEEHFLKKID